MRRDTKKPETGPINHCTYRISSSRDNNTIKAVPFCIRCCHGWKLAVDLTFFPQNAVARVQSKTQYSHWCDRSRRNCPMHREGVWDDIIKTVVTNSSPVSSYTLSLVFVCVSHLVYKFFFLTELNWAFSLPASRVRGLVPLKTHRVERLMHVKSVESQSSSVGVIWKFQLGFPAQDYPRHLTMLQNCEVRRQ
ncbi:hypothetical protein TNCV_4737331 [Trichonephila clavipes]|nr:hypothetical protein TNCV_4737331 [Trichonephila clavipes]